MRRLTRPLLLVTLGLTTLVLTSVVTAQFLLYRHDRLAHLEQVNMGLSREFARLIQEQLSLGQDLQSSSKILGRIVSLENRSGLISVLTVTDSQGKALFYFDDHPSATYDTPSLHPAAIQQDWRRTRQSIPAAKDFWSTYQKEMLFVSTEILGSDAQTKGMVTVGLTKPAPLAAFLIKTHSPLIVATVMIYLAAILAALISIRMRHVLDHSQPEPPLTGLGQEASQSTYDAAIQRAEQALLELDRLSR